MAPAAAKAFLWLWCRLSELVNLKWNDLRIIGAERHFEIVGEWGIGKSGPLFPLVSTRNSLI